MYGNLFALYLADKHEVEEAQQKGVTDPREIPFVREALASIAKGGYAEAMTRVGSLLARVGEPIKLEMLETRDEIARDYRDLLPDLTPDQWRRVRGEQEIIVRYEPEKAIETLPQLVGGAERERLVTLIERLLADERVKRIKPTPKQLATLDRVREVLGMRGPRLTAVKGPSAAA